MVNRQSSTPKTQRTMSNCSQHKKEVAGISDMKELAEMIGDLHYESLAQFIGELANKISLDAHKDEGSGKEMLSEQLYTVAGYLAKASIHSEFAWQISKPFMQEKHKEQMKDNTHYSDQTAPSFSFLL
jgi:hypothetical protein